MWEDILARSQKSSEVAAFIGLTGFLGDDGHLKPLDIADISECFSKKVLAHPRRTPRHCPARHHRRNSFIEKRFTETLHVCWRRALTVDSFLKPSPQLRSASVASLAYRD